MFSEDFSDNEVNDDSSSCSGDELEKYIEEKYNLTEQDGEDDFESEMESQLDNRVRFLEQTTILKKAPLIVAQDIQSMAQKKKDKSRDIIRYDLDSDDDSEADATELTAGQPSNDDLFYNPQEDEDDQAWADDQRRAYLHPEGSQGGPQVKLKSSDATLNCPACMTLLCRDCQRHEIYQTQYRAMFVVNCQIDFSETVEPTGKGSSRKRRKAKDGSRSDINEDVFHSVKCEICGTEVAAYDNNEVYHFHNIIASYT